MCFVPMSLFFTLGKFSSLDPQCLSRELWRGRGQVKGMGMYADKHFCPHVCQLDAVQCTDFLKKLARAMGLSDRLWVIWVVN